MLRQLAFSLNALIVQLAIELTFAFSFSIFVQCVRVGVCELMFVYVKGSVTVIDAIFKVGAGSQHLAVVVKTLQIN